MRLWVRSLALLSGGSDFAVRCGVGRGATAPIGPLAWEPPEAAGVALEKTKRQNKQTKKIIILEEKRSNSALLKQKAGEVLGTGVNLWKLKKDFSGEVGQCD